MINKRQWGRIRKQIHACIDKTQALGHIDRYEIKTTARGEAKEPLQKEKVIFHLNKDVFYQRERGSNNNH